jgi:recombination protein RecA
MDLGVTARVIEKSGAWFSFEGERIGQGRENGKQFLREHPELAARIEQLIKEKINPEMLQGKPGEE